MARNVRFSVLGRCALVAVVAGNLLARLADAAAPLFGAPYVVTPVIPPLISPSVGDFNDDGKLDCVALPGEFGGLIYVFVGVGNGTFALRHPLPAWGPTVAADFDGDG